MISLATEEDLPDIVDLSREFHAKTSWKGVFDEEAVFRMAQAVIEGPKTDGMILVAKDRQNRCTGLLGGLKSKLIFSGEDLALEVIWYSRKKKDLLILFDGFMYWAETVAKCPRIQVGTVVNNSALEKFYDKHGFTKVEESWIR